MTKRKKKTSKKIYSNRKIKRKKIKSRGIKRTKKKIMRGGMSCWKRQCARRRQPERNPPPLSETQSVDNIEIPIIIPSISDEILKGIFENGDIHSIYKTLNPINICSTQIRQFYIKAWEEIIRCREKGEPSKKVIKYQLYWYTAPFSLLNDLYLKLGACMPSLSFLLKVREICNKDNKSLIEVGGGNGFNCELFRLALIDKNVTCSSYDIKKRGESPGTSHEELITPEQLNITPPINSDGIEGIKSNNPDILLICWAWNINMITDSLRVFRGNIFILLHCHDYAPVEITTTDLIKMIEEYGFFIVYQEDEWFTSGFFCGPYESIHYYSEDSQRRAVPNNFCTIFTRSDSESSLSSSLGPRAAGPSEAGMLIGESGGLG